MSCDKNCRNIANSGIVRDVWKLYNPTVRLSGGYTNKGICKGKLSGLSCTKNQGKCVVKCQNRNCVDLDQFKYYWNKCNETPLVRRYESQPWFQNKLVQQGWREFMADLVTPFNIGCKACPGPDDWQFKCHRLRALVGPSVPCVWELPDQDNCATTQYGYNRDWRRYNEDERQAATDLQCGCNEMPLCKPMKEKCDWPPYLGKRFGARYMHWAYPSSMPFPRPQPFNYQSLPKC